MKLLEENIGSKPINIGLTNFWGGYVSSGRETKAKINKWDHFKLKSFCRGIPW